jgi:DNA-binding CsgD family transcriptional regulator/PAS domain-containing protein
VRLLTDPTIRFVAESPHKALLNSALDLDWNDLKLREHAMWSRHAPGSERWLLCYTTTPQGLAVGFSAYIARKDVAFEQSARRDLVILFGHMTRAQTVAARASLLQTSSEAGLVVDESAKILSMNATAEALARTGILNVSAGRLMLCDELATANLHTLVCNAAAVLDGPFATDTLRLQAPDGTSSYLLLVAPQLRAASAFQHLSRAVEVRIRRETTTNDMKPEDCWRRQFGFTPAEARVASQLLRTEGGLREVSEALGISYATARVHLARMFGKANVHTQAQLVRLLSLTSARIF